MKIYTFLGTSEEPELKLDKTLNSDSKFVFPDGSAFTNHQVCMYILMYTCEYVYVYIHVYVCIMYI
jgi:hypothetical protein